MRQAKEVPGCREPLWFPCSFVCQKVLRDLLALSDHSRKPISRTMHSVRNVNSAEESWEEKTT